MVSFVSLRTFRSSSFCGSSFFSRRFARKLLLYNYEGPADFVHNRRKVNCQQGLLWIDDHIRIRTRSRPRHPHGLAQAPLHAVALHRSAERAAHRESNAQPRSYWQPRRGNLRPGNARLRPRPIEHGHRRREMPPPLLVDALEVGVSQQPCATGKGAFARSRHGIMIRFSRHTGSHSDSKFQIAVLQRTVKITGATAGCADDCPRHWTIRGILVSPRPVYAPWRAGGKLPSCRPGSSCACEIRVSSIACAGWVGMYAWA